MELLKFFNSSELSYLVLVGLELFSSPCMFHSLTSDPLFPPYCFSGTLTWLVESLTFADTTNIDLHLLSYQKCFFSTVQIGLTL